MVKRYPPVCDGSTIAEATKPLFVQLMLIEKNGGEYHRALLQATYNWRGQLKFNFVKSSEKEEIDCTRSVSPSVLPGTLFMLGYE